MAQARERDDGPAKIGPGQVFVIETIAKGSGKGEAKRYRAVYPAHALTRALKARRISEDEFAAGEFYRAQYASLERSGRDSTVLEVIRGGTGMPWTQAQAEAFRTLQDVERKLPNGPPNWALIIRRFCGQGDEAVEACRKGGVKNPRLVWPTMRLALSKLGAAISGVRAWS